MDILEATIRDVPDFPKPGILFKDITPVLQSPEAFKATVDALIRESKKLDFDVICGIESRGFLFGSVLSYQLGKGFIPLRKPGKLPYKTVTETYTLEYGTNTLEIHEDALQPGQRVLVVDDLLATGGTATAAGRLIERLGGEVAGYMFVIELDFLHGRDKLTNGDVISLVRY